jgi:hypothetical protein
MKLPTWSILFNLKQTSRHLLPKCRKEAHLLLNETCWQDALVLILSYFLITDPWICTFVLPHKLMARITVLRNRMINSQLCHMLLLQSSIHIHLLFWYLTKVHLEFFYCFIKKLSRVCLLLHWVMLPVDLNLLWTLI